MQLQYTQSEKIKSKLVHLKETYFLQWCQGQISDLEA